MTEQTNLTFAAIVTISLPNTDTKATASVTLTPVDTVATGQQSKRLTECTLADLQRFAEQWQADVWATYNEITLLDLVADVDNDLGGIGAENGALQSPYVVVTFSKIRSKGDYGHRARGVSLTVKSRYFFLLLNKFA